MKKELKEKKMGSILDHKWLEEYFDRYKESIFNDQTYADFIKIKDIWVKVNKNRKKVIFAGNGGSAALASHCSVDLTKAAGIRAINFNEADLITCFANDYGYDNWVSNALEFYGEEGDCVVLVSSSGNSMNMVQAAKSAKKLGMRVITFTGFEQSNKLKQLGEINLWVDSKAYNIVEMTHHIWILSIVDLIIGNAEYSAS